MIGVVVFSQERCGHCHAARKLLIEQRIHHVYVVLGKRGGRSVKE